MEKPSVEFFEQVVEAAPCAADEIGYVGDRIDNDVAPAKKVGRLPPAWALGLDSSRIT
ncbi:HAD hydrolase-like protein [Nocardia huaxiensis]|uniref:HAD hydrolase-like protein n=1 Tax=Nocardia huaxiensis TaxID=2755382 RepID=UPI001FD3D986|nr:HAD hydrolase-like protein [Nocardia huaxiensis]